MRRTPRVLVQRAGRERDSVSAGLRRALSRDDITHDQRIVVALKETLRLMAEIDRAIPGWPIV